MITSKVYRLQKGRKTSQSSSADVRSSADARLCHTCYRFDRSCYQRSFVACPFRTCWSATHAVSCPYSRAARSLSNVLWAGRIILFSPAWRLRFAMPIPLCLMLPKPFLNARVQWFTDRPHSPVHGKERGAGSLTISDHLGTKDLRPQASSTLRRRTTRAAGSPRRSYACQLPGHGRLHPRRAPPYSFAPTGITAVRCFRHRPKRRLCDLQLRARWIMQFCPPLPRWLAR
jgi:hypothetical protein